MVLHLVRAEYINARQALTSRHRWLRFLEVLANSLLACCAQGSNPWPLDWQSSPLAKRSTEPSTNSRLKKRKKKKRKKADTRPRLGAQFQAFHQLQPVFDRQTGIETNFIIYLRGMRKQGRRIVSQESHTRCNFCKFSSISLLPLSGQFSWQVKHPIKRRREICSNAQSCHENNKDSGVIGILEPYHFVALFVVTIFTKTLYSTCTCRHRVLTKDKR